MSCKPLAALALVSTLFAVWANAADVSKQTYVVAKTLPLRKTANGVAGTLQLSMDSRLTDSVQKEMWGRGDWSYVFDPESEIYKQFVKLPPGNARLTISDSANKLIATRDLATPLATLEA